MNVSQLILCLFVTAIGCILFRNIHKKHKRIDTESIAVVSKVQELGRSEGKKVYAIYYTVKASEPFEIIETPCRKKRNIGKERVVYYEKAAIPKDGYLKNYYFKTIGTWDRRFNVCCYFFFFGIIFFISSIISMF